jgi:NAD(P)-dependent dehydrogenase (short-subunit alcohol dehydrogenase family)
VGSVPEIISALRAVAPAGRPGLADAERRELRELTRELKAALPGALDEVRRFEGIRSRSVPVPAAELDAWLAGKTVLVTGGTGCIGSALLAQVVGRGAARLVSVSRGHAGLWPRHDPVEYLHADIADQASLAAIFGSVRPDLVFHVAAQRDPGLAEREVHRTVRTNVLGTSNVIGACTESGVAELVAASTGKALRPYSREVYTASKRSAEWLLASAAAGTGIRVSASRFTHVVDNSIVRDRLVHWAGDGVIRLHDAQTLFYAQSALESAQLLLSAGLRATAGALRVSAISDLGWPISLLELVIGTLLEQDSDSPVYVSGHDPGYESVPFPGLYDPATAGEVSPLLSAFEAAACQHDDELGIDTAVLAFGGGAAARQLLANLSRASADGGAASVLAALDALSWELFEAALAMLPPTALARAAARAEPYSGELSCDHTRMLDGLRKHAGVSQREMAGPGVLH